MSSAPIETQCLNECQYQLRNLHEVVNRARQVGNHNGDCLKNGNTQCAQNTLWLCLQCVDGKESVQTGSVSVVVPWQHSNASDMNSRYGRLWEVACEWRVLLQDNISWTLQTLDNDPNTCKVPLTFIQLHIAQTDSPTLVINLPMDQVSTDTMTGIAHLVARVFVPDAALQVATTNVTLTIAMELKDLSKHNVSRIRLEIPLSSKHWRFTPISESVCLQAQPPLSPSTDVDEEKPIETQSPITYLRHRLGALRRPMTPARSLTSAFCRVHAQPVYVISDASDIGRWLHVRNELSAAQIPAMRLHHHSQVLLSLEKYTRPLPEPDQSVNHGHTPQNLERPRTPAHHLSEQILDRLLCDEHSSLSSAVLVLERCVAQHVASPRSPSPQSSSLTRRLSVCYVRDRVVPCEDFERRVYEVTKYLKSSCDVVLWGCGGSDRYSDAALCLRGEFGVVTPVYVPFTKDRLPQRFSHYAFSLSIRASEMFQGHLWNLLCDTQSQTNENLKKVSDGAEVPSTDSLLSEALRRTTLAFPESTVACNPCLFVLTDRQTCKRQTLKAPQTSDPWRIPEFVHDMCVPSDRSPPIAMPKEHANDVVGSEFRISVILVVPVTQVQMDLDRLTRVLVSLAEQTYGEIELTCLDLNENISNHPVSPLTHFQGLIHQAQPSSALSRWKNGKNVKLVRRAPNESLSRSLASALSSSTGSFTMFHSVDGVSQSDRLSRQLAGILYSKRLLVSCERGLLPGSSGRLSQAMVQQVILQQEQHELCLYSRSNLDTCINDHPSLWSASGVSCETLGDFTFALFNALIQQQQRTHDMSSIPVSRSHPPSYAQLPFYHCIPLKLFLH